MSYKDPYDIMSDRELKDAERLALDELLHRAKHSHDSNFVARCWLKGILYSLKKSGYDICLKKNGLEIGL